MSEINSVNYVDNVMRTAVHDIPGITERLQNPDTIQLLHAAIGLSTEAGEFLDMLKRHIFYGTPLDIPNAKEEIGDSQWYAGLAIKVLQTTMDEILTLNIEKLRLRYPEKFTEEKATYRDLQSERKLLETSEPNWEAIAQRLFKELAGGGIIHPDWESVARRLANELGKLGQDCPEWCNCNEGHRTCEGSIIEHVQEVLKNEQTTA